MAILLAAVLSGCAFGPAQSVLPYPDHIRAGLKTGDRAEISTVDGKVIHGTVDSIEADAVVLSGEIIRFDDIKGIRVRRFKHVANPCSDDTPVGCSIPGALSMASEFHAQYAERFNAACSAHDYCYRHGFQTYGDSRRDCDTRFLDEMRNRCRGFLDLDPGDHLRCLLAASTFHAAVRRAGKSRFLTRTGSYCEYRGPSDR